MTSKLATVRERRRERFLSEEMYQVFTTWTSNHTRELRALLKEKLNSSSNPDAAFTQWSGGVAAHSLERIVGAYSAGDPLENMTIDFESCLLSIESAALPHRVYQTEPLYLNEPDSYAWSMWLLSLAKLLQLEHLLPRVAALFDVAKEENRGKDALFECLSEKLELPYQPAKNCLKNVKAHPLLLEAIHADPAQRPKHVARFLDKWYPSMKACYWHGRHTRVPQNFFGYWAFEAGLVTYLWEIDDSSYRDMPFYPKDLVDYARSHPAAVAQSPSFAGPITPASVRAPAPCPQAGFWFTPAQHRSRRHFNVGEAMPDVGGDYGATIWQWDLNQG